ncbi:hypothetical protein EON67_00310 [archaeon]|nr:MAG: hypothetical protein EON67_00310 [archaeon]
MWRGSMRPRRVAALPAACAEAIAKSSVLDTVMSAALHVPPLFETAVRTLSDVVYNYREYVLHAVARARACVCVCLMQPPPALACPHVLHAPHAWCARLACHCSPMRDAEIMNKLVPTILQLEAVYDAAAEAESMDQLIVLASCFTDAAEAYRETCILSQGDAEFEARKVRPFTLCTPREPAPVCLAGTPAVYAVEQ